MEAPDFVSVLASTAGQAKGTPVEFEMIFKDKYFKRLIKESSCRPLSKRKLAELPLPVGLSSNEAWDCLYMVNRAFGIDVPLKPLEVESDQNFAWYRETSCLVELKGMLLRYCNSESSLARTLNASSHQQFFIQMRVEDISASALLDGLSIDTESVDGLFHDTFSPRTAAEKLMLNAFRIDESLEAYIDRPFSVEMIEGFKKELFDDVAYEDLEFLDRAWGIEPADHHGSEGDLGKVIAYANDEIGEKADSPLVRGSIIVDSLRFSRIGGPAASLVGRIIARIYYAKHDLPVLGMLPINRARVLWEQGRIPQGKTSCTRKEHEETVDLIYKKAPIDITWHVLLSAELAAYELEIILDHIEKWKVRDEELKASLKEGFFNHRQRSMLARAQANPEAELLIRYHQNNHNVAYATARKDFLELEASGYLTREKRGKAYIFKAGPNIKAPKF